MEDVRTKDALRVCALCSQELILFILLNCKTHFLNNLYTKAQPSKGKKNI